jgi:Domain of unknown function (DUF4399)
MFRKLLAITAIAVTISSCNSETKTAETQKTDTMAMNHDDHGTTASTDIPALPVIPEGAKVFFNNLKEGQTVTSPFKVEMASEKLSVDTANGIVKEASGHYHILIGLDSTAAGIVVPKDSTHLHYGNAQTSTELKLTPGTYKLTLQFADALHRSYGGKLATSVNVTVK